MKQFRPISIPFSHFDIILECPGETNRRTEWLYQYHRPLQKLLLVLNYCRDCRVFETESNKYPFLLMQNLLLQKYYDRGYVRTLRPLFVYATEGASNKGGLGKQAIFEVNVLISQTW